MDALALLSPTEFYSKKKEENHNDNEYGSTYEYKKSSGSVGHPKKEKILVTTRHASRTPN